MATCRYPGKNTFGLRLSLSVLMATTALLLGCAERTWNKPIASTAANNGATKKAGELAAGADDGPYDFMHRLPKGNSQKIFIVLAFSGGGVRASAFAYGILEALRDTRITVDGRERRLLDEVDIITSVSGGSYPAAYYGLFGDRIFKDFRAKFLTRGLSSVFFRNLFTTKHLHTLVHPELNRGDIAAKWFGDNLFENKTFRDMGRGDLPFVIVNASDLNTGMTFSFIQQQFDFLCSDIRDYPVSNAVVASSAIPVVMGPISLRNYARDCPERHQGWVQDALSRRNFKSRRYQVARALVRYMDPKRLPVIRLMDGGITDNLAVRGSVLSPVAHYGDVARMAGAFTRASSGKLRRVMTIVVNAQVYRSPKWSVSGKHPHVLQVLRASFDAAIDILNTEAATLASLEFRRWTRRINRTRGKDAPPLESHFALVTFDQIRDPKKRAWFNAIPTSASITDEQVDRVRALARELLYAQPKFRAFLKAYRGRLVTSDATR